jgi:hypothetical protein
MQRCTCCCNAANENNPQQKNLPSTFITRQRLSDNAIILGLTTLFTVIAIINWWLFSPGL